MPKLEKWSVGGHHPDPYYPPEFQQPALHGIVYGHHRKSDGSEVTTSPIVGVEGEFVKTESGTLYELGEVYHAYEAAFPNAKQKLFNSYAAKDKS